MSVRVVASLTDPSVIGEITPVMLHDIGELIGPYVISGPDDRYRRGRLRRYQSWLGQRLRERGCVQRIAFAEVLAASRCRNVVLVRDGDPEANQLDVIAGYIDAAYIRPWIVRAA